MAGQNVRSIKPPPPPPGSPTRPASARVYRPSTPVNQRPTSAQPTPRSTFLTDAAPAAERTTDTCDRDGIASSTSQGPGSLQQDKTMLELLLLSASPSTPSRRKPPSPPVWQQPAPGFAAALPTAPAHLAAPRLDSEVARRYLSSRPRYTRGPPAAPLRAAALRQETQSITSAALARAERHSGASARCTQRDDAPSIAGVPPMADAPTDALLESKEASPWRTRVRRPTLRQHRHVGVLHKHSKAALTQIFNMNVDELARYIKQPAELLKQPTDSTREPSSPERGRKLSSPPKRLSSPPKRMAQPTSSAERSAIRARRIASEAQVLHESMNYVDLGFEAQAAGVANVAQLRAARAFDRRHRSLVAATQNGLATLKHDPTSAAAAVGFDRGVAEVLRNRYALEEVYDPFGPPVGPAKGPRRYHRYHKPWTLEESQWVGRRDHGNAQSFFEDQAALHRMMQTDWNLAREHHQLAWVICQAQHSREFLEREQITKASAAEAPCVNAVHEVLKRHAMLIYNTFDHYAMIDKKPTIDMLNKSEIFYIRLSQFFHFVADMHLEADDLDLGHIESIFAVVDAPDKGTSKEDRHNVRQALNRHEWLQVLVRLAMRKFCVITSRGNVVGHVADAVARLCIDHLMAFVPRVCLLNHNEFRTEYCYRESTDGVLKANRATLRNLFDVYAAASNDGMQNTALLADKSRISLGEWLTFVQHIGLFDLNMLTMQTAQQAFAWSRIRAAKDWSDMQEIRVRSLHFEDFLECLVRISSIIALPTNEEIEASGAADAGEFMLGLLCDAPEAFRQFVAVRTGRWEEHPHQQIHRCLSHVISFVRRIVQANFSSDPDHGLEVGPLSKGTIDKFFRRRHGEGGAPPEPLGLPRNHLSGALLTSAMERVEAGIFAALRSVLAFECLTDDDIHTLRGAMSVAKYKDGEYVFEQGQPGDVFYLITGGEAEVLHYDPKDRKQEEVLLNVLSVPACFGETALLKKAPRNASVMAKGELHVVYITSSEFEVALGRPLAEMKLAHEHQDELRLAKLGAEGVSEEEEHKEQAAT